MVSCVPRTRVSPEDARAFQYPSSSRRPPPSLRRIPLARSSSHIRPCCRAQLDVHRRGTAPLPRNFLATLWRLRFVNVNATFLSYPRRPTAFLTQHPHLNSLKLIQRAELVVHTHDEFLDCLSRTPSPETLVTFQRLAPFATPLDAACPSCIFASSTSMTMHTGLRRTKPFSSFLPQSPSGPSGHAPSTTAYASSLFSLHTSAEKTHRTHRHSQERTTRTLPLLATKCLAQGLG